MSGWHDWPEPWSRWSPTRMGDGTTWDPMARVNMTAAGRTFLKTRFPGEPVEWAWVEITDSTDPEEGQPILGLLGNDLTYQPLPAGTRVAVRIIPPGQELAGFSEFVALAEELES